MQTHDEGTHIEETDIAVLQIIRLGMAQATEETIKKFGEDTLTQLLLATVAAPIAGPIAAGAAAMLTTLAKGVFRETSAIDRKLNKILAQPFKTASQTVRQVLSEEVRDSAEEARATERLKRAADQLDEAYTYAEADSPQRRLLVRVYQCLVAGLLEGGGAALRQYLGELRWLGARARDQANRERAAAARVRRRDPGVVAEVYELRAKLAQSNPALYKPLLMGGWVPPLPEAHLNEILDAQANGHIRRAEEYEQNAEALEQLCVLLENVHASKREILRADKLPELRSRLMTWLGRSY